MPQLDPIESDLESDETLVEHDNITSRKKLKSYILNRLGYPSIDVEVTDGQLDVCINDAVQKLRMYADVADERQFFVVHTKKGQAKYPVPDNVRAVLRVMNSRRDGINTLFTLENVMYQRGELYFNNFSLVGYQIANQYIKTMDDIMGQDIMFKFSDPNDEITVYPTPTEKGTLMFEVYVEVDSPELFDHPFTKKYALGMAKTIWGAASSKYKVNLPHGGEINLERLIDEGKKQMEEAEEDLLEKYTAPPTFFMA